MRKPRHQHGRKSEKFHNQRPIVTKSNILRGFSTVFVCSRQLSVRIVCAHFPGFSVFVCGFGYEFVVAIEQFHILSALRSLGFELYEKSEPSAVNITYPKRSPLLYIYFRAVSSNDFNASHAHYFVLIVAFHLIHGAAF